MLANKDANRYTTPNGADFIRCVGAVTTCAGAWELALPCTAVILFSCPHYTICNHILQLAPYTKISFAFCIWCHTIYKFLSKTLAHRHTRPKRIGQCVLHSLLHTLCSPKEQFLLHQKSEAGFTTHVPIETALKFDSKKSRISMIRMYIFPL